jgi:hypothetical protein
MAPLLPCQTLDGIRTFKTAGVAVVGARRYYAVMSTSKGGVVRIFDKQAERITYEDAGYHVQAERSWTSQALGLGTPVPGDAPDEIACETPLVEVCQEVLTPGRLLILRLLNLTLFRSRTLASAIQRRVIRRLITARRPGPLRLRRSITFGCDAVRVHDRLETTGRVSPLTVRLPRAFTPIHMGSAKYFHTSQLEPLRDRDCTALGPELSARGRVVHEFVISFPGEPTAGASAPMDGSAKLEAPSR